MEKIRQVEQILKEAKRPICVHDIQTKLDFPQADLCAIWEAKVK